MRKIEDLNLEGKTVLLRVDYNIPIANGKISDDSRIKSTIPTIKYLLDKNAKIILLSHMGRPNGFSEELSLKQVLSILEKHIGQPVAFCEDMDKVLPNNAQIILLENLRFFPGETDNSPEFAVQLAKLGDIYINDCFSNSHRQNASITHLARMLPSAAGISLAKEISSLEEHLKTLQKPVTVIIGGAKISTKISLLSSLSKIADTMIIGGAMANNFFKAKRKDIGISVYEEDYIDETKKVINEIVENGCNLVLPDDVVITTSLEDCNKFEIVGANDTKNDKMIVDIGPHTIIKIKQIINDSKTIILNGPLGAFEQRPFHEGTKNVYEEIARCTEDGRLVSIAGGGHTTALLNQLKVGDKFSYVSNGGGAFLEWLEKEGKLPGTEALK